VCVRRCKWNLVLCQNCVTYPLKPWASTAIYRDTAMHIVVAGSRWWDVRWWVLMSVSTRGGTRFPSVLLQPLGHLSALESTVCERSLRDYDRRRCFCGCFGRSTFGFSEFDV